MELILFDDITYRPALYPLTLTRAVADLRIGILTIRQKWELLLKQSSLTHTDPYLCYDPAPEKGLFVNASALPTAELARAIMELPEGKALSYRGDLVAYRGAKARLTQAFEQVAEYDSELLRITRPADLFLHNAAQIAADIQLLYPTGNTGPGITDPHTVVYHPENVYVEEGVKVRAAIINASAGPVYLGAGAEVCEGSIIIGPFALGAQATVNPGAKMRAGTTIGPRCKVGGEVSNSIIMGHSNKGHDGFLGNAVVGEWCNLGADTNCSNLKNDYGSIKVWNYPAGDYVDTGLQFHGLIMGDHSKSGINTMFNTGTVVGVSANIFGEGFPPKFIPSFTWGMGKDTYRFDKALQAANNMMQRRNMQLSDKEVEMLKKIFENEKL